jgi:hypothetical protein
MYGLGGPGLESRKGQEISSHPKKVKSGSGAQPPYNSMGPRIPSRLQSGLGAKLTANLYPVPWLKMSGAMRLFPPPPTCLLSINRDNFYWLLPSQCMIFLEELTETCLVNKRYVFTAINPNFSLFPLLTQNCCTNVLFTPNMWCQHACNFASVRSTTRCLTRELQQSTWQLRSSWLSDTARRGNSLPTRNQFFTLEEGTKRLSQNVGSKVPLLVA